MSRDGSGTSASTAAAASGETETAPIAADGRDIDIIVCVMREVHSGQCNISQSSPVTDILKRGYLSHNLTEF